MSDVTIRAAAPADVAAITRIYAEAVKHGTATFEIEPPDEAEMARRLRTLVAGNYPYLVAARSGALAGYAYAGPYHLRPAYRWTVEDSVYLDRQFQGQGIGRLLMRQLLADAEALPADDRACRRFNQHGVDRAACGGRLPTRRHAAIGRIQTWPLARCGGDAAPARQRGFKLALGAVKIYRSQNY
jgi:L-amino acid N-acyltransferase YncA